MIKVNKCLVAIILTSTLLLVTIFSYFRNNVGENDIDYLASKRINVSEKIIYSEISGDGSFYNLFVQYNGSDKVTKRSVDKETYKVFQTINGGDVTGYTKRQELDGVEYYEYFGDFHGIGLTPYEIKKVTNYYGVNANNVSLFTTFRIVFSIFLPIILIVLLIFYNT